MGNVLRTLLHGEIPQNITTAKEFVDEALSIATHAMRAGVHTTLGSNPVSLQQRHVFKLTFDHRLACNQSKTRTSHP